MGCRTEFFFFLWKKNLTVRFSGVKFTGDYRNVAIISTLFRDHSQNSKKPNFSSFFRHLTVVRNNYVMIPTTWQFLVNFTPKNYTSKLNFEKKKFSIPERGHRFGLKIEKRAFSYVGRNLISFSISISFSFSISISFSISFSISISISISNIYLRFQY